MTSTNTDGDMVSRFGIDEAVGVQLRPNWNVAPTQRVRIFLERDHEGGSGSSRRLETARWGLVPVWANDRSVSQ
ncbi:hypothetical protein GCM10009596_25930 [Arthrobacter rhombi]|uniref:SOS response-associated peptidase family protein n=1 Tax=Arthrobacter rhombi TaxID=71253 RepID=UPI0031DB0DCE